MTKNYSKPIQLILISSLGLWLTGGYQLITNPVTSWWTDKQQECKPSYITRAKEYVAEAQRHYPTIEDVLATDKQDKQKPRTRRESIFRQLKDSIHDSSERPFERWSQTDRRINRQPTELNEVIRADFDGDGVEESYRVYGQKRY